MIGNALTLILIMTISSRFTYWILDQIDSASDRTTKTAIAIIDVCYILTFPILLCL